MSAGRVTLYVATSVDGYVADVEGGVDWLDEFHSETDEEDAGFSKFFETVDCLVMGATTYEQILGFGDWPYADRPTYVFTHRNLSPATEAVEFVDQGVTDLSSDLKAQYDHVWLVGGPQLARSFLRVEQVDTVRLSIVPVLLGDGIPLFSGGYERQDLELADTSVHENGIVEHIYEVLGSSSAR